MVTIKTPQELEAMREAGRIAAEALRRGGAAVAPGVSTAEIDAVIHDCIREYGATPSFLGYGGFPAASCISLDNEVIHGIPGGRKIAQGSIVKIDVGAFIGGFHGDNAATYLAGEVPPEAEKLAKVTRESFFKGLKFARAGARIGDIGSAVSTYVESFGYRAVTKYVGHGIGRKLHEEPSVPNYGKAGRGMRLEPGMVICIEPMINVGAPDVSELSDGWTVITKDGSLSAHYEHTVAITAGEPEILTIPAGRADLIH